MAAPKTWPIARKATQFVLRPEGSHSYEFGMPLGLVLREMLSLVNNAREAKYLLRENDIKVDGKRVIEPSRIVGFMDVLEIPVVGSYRVSINKNGKLELKQIPAAESKYKICKVNGKKSLRKNQTAIYLHDGKSIVGKTDFRVGDSALYDFGSKTVERLELKEKASVILTGGKHIGYVGNIVKIIPTKVEEDKVVVKTKDEEFVTLKKFVFVIGKEKPQIAV